MSMTIFKGILIPFLGTSLGAACVLFMKKNLHYLVQRALTGFAAGVMVAASVWSLLIPSMEQSAKMGRLRFVPAAVGFMLGVFFLLFDHFLIKNSTSLQSSPYRVYVTVAVTPFSVTLSSTCRSFIS